MRSATSVRRARRRDHAGVQAVAVLLAMGVLTVPLPAIAGPRDFLIYAPGQGAASDEAKPYLDKLFRALEKQLGWPVNSMGGEYADERSARAAINFHLTKPASPAELVALLRRVGDTLEAIRGELPAAYGGLSAAGFGRTLQGLAG